MHGMARLSGVTAMSMSNVKIRITVHDVNGSLGVLVTTEEGQVKEMSFWKVAIEEAERIDGGRMFH